ncbi:heterodisulfide reductase [Candidatus Fermentibacteria bacterium]|nr:heterodisulfide reductase [Candidatus Fermentibacteria bacterium]
MAEGADNETTPRLRLDREKVRGEFGKRLDSLSEQHILACYQCGNCSSGCPLAEEMDLLPSTVMHLVQLGQSEAVLNSRSIWVCASCLQCTVRCPKGIDIQKVMDVLRQMALAEGIDHFGPDQVDPRNAAEVPQPGLVSAYRKLST